VCREGGTYPHALHSAHGPERSQCSERSHRFERLNATGTTKRRYEVYKRDLMKLRNVFHKDTQIARYERLLQCYSLNPENLKQFRIKL
jgi:hypothetical protein